MMDHVLIEFFKTSDIEVIEERNVDIFMPNSHLCSFSNVSEICLKVVTRII